MNSLYTIKLKEAQKNREGYISMMSGWDDGRLSKHIDLFREQRAMAYKKGDEDAMLLMDEYEWQVIEARMRKNYELGIRNGMKYLRGLKKTC